MGMSNPEHAGEKQEDHHGMKKFFRGGR